jgi:hypothetical protein
MLILDPIGLDEQIQDAILGTIRPTVEGKARILAQYLDRPMRINGVRAFRQSIEGANVEYFIRRASKTAYYYPIQYAKIEIDL